MANGQGQMPSGWAIQNGRPVYVGDQKKTPTGQPQMPPGWTYENGALSYAAPQEQQPQAPAPEEAEPMQVPLFAGKPVGYVPDTGSAWSPRVNWEGIKAMAPGVEGALPDLGAETARDHSVEANAPAIVSSRTTHTPPLDISGKPVESMDALLTTRVPEVEKILSPDDKKALALLRQAKAKEVQARYFIDQQQAMLAPLREQEAWQNNIFRQRYENLTQPPPASPQTAGSYWAQQAVPFVAALAPGAKGLPGPAGLIQPALGIASNLMKSGGIDPTTGLPLNESMQIPNEPVRPGVSLFAGMPQGRPVQLETSTPQALSEIPEKGVSTYGLEESARGYPEVVTAARKGLLGVLDMLGSPENAAIIFGTGGALKLIQAEFGPKMAGAVGKLITSKFGYDIGENLATERARQIGEGIEEWKEGHPGKLVEGLVGAAADVGFLLHPRLGKGKERLGGMIPETARGIKEGVEAATRPRIETEANRRLAEQAKAQTAADLARVTARVREIDRQLAEPGMEEAADLKAQLLAERERALEAQEVARRTVSEERETFGTKEDAVARANQFGQGAAVEQLPDGRWVVRPVPATEGGVKTPAVVVPVGEKEEKELPPEAQPPAVPPEVAPPPIETAPAPPEAPKAAPGPPEAPTGVAPGIKPGEETVRGQAAPPGRVTEIRYPETPEDKRAKQEWEQGFKDAHPDFPPDKYPYLELEGQHAASLWMRNNPGRSMAEFYKTHAPTMSYAELRRATGEPYLQSEASLAHPTFFSAAERAIEQKMPKAATPEQIKGILSPQNGVKPDELAWVGLDDVAEAFQRKRLITKDELLDYIRQHNVRVEVTTRGDAEITELTKKIQDVYNEGTRLYGKLSPIVAGRLATLTPEFRELELARYKQEESRRRGGEAAITAEMEAALRSYWEAIDRRNELEEQREKLREERPSTRYSQYKLPGGENYREVLLRLPEEKGRPRFTESHWPEPDVMVHLRTTDRVDADGKKTLFFEEVQSDWVKKGRERGFLPRRVAPSRPVIPGMGSFAVQDAEWNILHRFQTREEAVRALLAGAVPGGRHVGLDYTQIDPQAIVAAGSRAANGPLPDMPFKKAYPLLAFKWALRYAVEHGYDKIAWTTGKQQAERYSLGTVVEQINWRRYEGPNRDISRSVIIHPKGGRRNPFTITVQTDGTMTSLGQPELNGKRLDEAVGKDLAKRIMEEERGQIDAEGLVIGGEGMKGFYDQILPSEYGKYVKKWGGQVGKAEIETKPGGAGRMPRTTPALRGALRGQGNLGFENPEPAARAIFDHPDWATRWDIDPVAQQVIRQWLGSAETTPAVMEPVHSIDITPQMKEAVLQGQPLFQREPIAASDRPMPPAETFRKYATEIRRGGDYLKETMRKAFGIIGNRSVQEYVAAAMAGRAQKGWYARSTQAIRDTFGADADRFSSLVAALSPQQGVPANLKMAVNVWEAWLKRGRPTDQAALRKMFARVYGEKYNLVDIKSRLNNAVTALSDPYAKLEDQKTLSGLKVDNFRRNLQGDLKAVTNDTWMARFGEMNEALFGERYGYAASSYLVRRAAEKLGWEPAEVQETIWSFYKALYETMKRGERIVDKGGFGTGERKGAVTAMEALRGMTHGELVEKSADIAKLLSDPDIQQRLSALGYTGRPRPRGRLVGANARENIFGDKTGHPRLLGRIAERTQQAFDKSAALEELKGYSEDTIREFSDAEREAYRRDLGLGERLTRDAAVADLLRERELATAGEPKTRRITPEFIAPGWLQKMTAEDKAQYTQDILDSVDHDELARAVGLVPGKTHVNRGFYDGYSNPAPHIEIDLPPRTSYFTLLPKAKRMAAAIGQIHDQESVGVIIAKPATFVRNANAMFFKFDRALSTEDIVEIGNALAKSRAWLSPKEDGLFVGAIDATAADRRVWHEAVIKTVEATVPKGVTFHYSLLDNAGTLVERSQYGDLLRHEAAPAGSPDLQVLVDRARGRVAETRRYYADKYGVEGTEAGAPARAAEAPVEALYQEGKTTKGAFYPGTEIEPRAAIQFFKKADFTTAVHEMGHFIETLLTPAEKGVLAKTYGEGWDQIREQKERFARDYERYFTTGQAPAPRLQSIFQKIAGWMREVYKTARASIFGEELAPEVKAFWDDHMARYFPSGEEAVDRGALPEAGKVLEPSTTEKAALESALPREAPGAPQEAIRPTFPSEARMGPVPAPKAPPPSAGPSQAAAATTAAQKPILRALQPSKSLVLAPAVSADPLRLGKVTLGRRLAEVVRDHDQETHALHEYEKVFDRPYGGKLNRTLESLDSSDPAFAKKIRDIAESWRQNDLHYEAKELEKNAWAIQLLDRIEKGDVSSESDPELRTFADHLKGTYSKLQDAMDALGETAQNTWKVDWFPHIWRDPEAVRSWAKELAAGEPKAAAKLLAQRLTPGGQQKAAVSRAMAMTGKAPLQGPKGFLKERTIPTIMEGLEQGFVPVDWNPVRMHLLKVSEINRFLMAHRMFNDLRYFNALKYLRNGQRIVGWSTIEDPIFQKFLPPFIEVPEFLDAPVYEGMMRLAKELGVDVATVAKIKGRPRAMGVQYVGQDRVERRFGGDVGILVHEIGHALQEKLRLIEKFDADPAMKLELDALADARMKDPAWTKANDPVYYAYAHNPMERIANLIHAYVHAPQLLDRLAPKTGDRLDEMIVEAKKKGEPLGLLGEIEPGVRLDENIIKLKRGGTPQVGAYFMPDKMAGVFNNYLKASALSQGDWGEASKGPVQKVGRGAYKLYRKSSNLMLMARLGWSGFHVAFTTSDAMLSKMALAGTYIRDGKFAEATKAIAEMPLTGFGNLVSGIAQKDIGGTQGVKGLKEWYEPGTQGEEVGAIIKALEMGGYRARMSRSEELGAWNQFLRAARQRDVVKLAGKAFPFMLEAGSRIVMNRIVPTQKMSVAMDLARRDLLKLRGEITGPAPPGGWSLADVLRMSDPARVADIMRRNVVTVESRMGQVTYDNWNMSRTAKDLAFASLQSVGWNAGTWEQVGGGIKDLTYGMARGAIKGRPRDLGGEPLPLITDRAAYMVTLPIFAGMIGYIVNKLYGQEPEELIDYYFPKTGMKNPDGSDARVSMPMYAKEVYGLLSGFFRGVAPTEHLGYGLEQIATIVSHKVNPAWSTAVAMLQDKDFFGRQIYSKDDPASRIAVDLIKYLFKGNLPYALTSMERTKETGEERPLGLVAPYLGLVPASKAITKSEFEKRAMEKARATWAGPPTTKTQGERIDTKRKIEGLMRRGKHDEARQMLWDAEKKGLLGQKDRNDILARYAATRLDDNLKILRLPDAVFAFEGADPKQLAQYGHILREKLRTNAGRTYYTKEQWDGAVKRAHELLKGVPSKAPQKAPRLPGSYFGPPQRPITGAPRPG